jgi:glutamate dehydrogenase
MIDTALTTSASPAARGVFASLRSTVRRDVMTPARVRGVIARFPNIVKYLFADFVARLSPVSSDVKENAEERSSQITSLIRREAQSELDLRILTMFQTFNSHLLKTNFFKTTKGALSFRLNPAFMDTRDFPTRPFGLFFVVGAAFIAFHVRFADIARGGIRVIKSANKAAYSTNVATLFEENYNLALTQQWKNKDIPEGGSKGTILLSLFHQNKGDVAFKKYVDALLDLLLPHEQVVDLYGQPEILFLGPDENTAELMDWASEHSHYRGYPFWKGFTTGKGRHLGGIPHDMYGMTTRSVHQYVL